ncbi:HlyD family secretion protein [Phreatobacter stygius]|uniref:HlyD family secretion protein n=1 Tax=Phreatobacter stygius TaxID=1940610 RepID=A0A4D7B594_9HYPH|nr:HlyD family secretion protein [Phreatobacter stygius]QCI68161.1 HlyD family secretion protein [Phreatobacter stygius]
MADVREDAAPGGHVQDRRAAAPEAAPAPQGGPAAASPPAKSSRKRLVLALVAAAVIGAAGWFGYDWYVDGRFLVSTDDAYVKADTTVLAAKISGYVVEVAVRDNASVHAGEVLARIDDGDYRLAVEAAAAKVATQDSTIQRIEAQRAAQDAMVAQARAQLAVAQADTQRTVAALARAQRLISQEFASQAALDTAKADRDRNIAQVEQAKATISGAEAQSTVLQAQRTEAERQKAELQNALDRARRDLDFTVVRAPVDGVVGNRAVQIGQFVQPGTRLLALVATASIYVEANLKETQLSRIMLGDSVNVSVDAFSGKPIRGRVESIAPASGAIFSLLPPENATGNFTKIVQRIPVRIMLDPAAIAHGRLRPGMSVVASIRIGTDPEPARVGATDQGSRRTPARLGATEQSGRGQP